MEQRNWFYRGFNTVYERIEKLYTGLIRRIVEHSGVSVTVALILIGIRTSDYPLNSTRDC